MAPEVLKVQDIRDKLNALKGKVEQEEKDRRTTLEEKEELTQEKEELKKKLKEKKAENNEDESAQITDIENNVLPSIEKAIDKITPVATPDPLAAPDPASQSPWEKIGEQFKRISNYVSEAIGKLSAGTLSGLRTLFTMLGWQRTADMLNQYVEPADIRAAMKKKLGTTIPAQARDGEIATKLREQHQALITASAGKLNAGNYSFEKFYNERIDGLEASKKPNPTLEDLLETHTGDEVKAKKKAEEEEKAKKEAEEKVKEEERKKEAQKAKEREAKEAIERDPQLRDHMSVLALVQAFNDIVPNFIPLTLPLNEEALKSLPEVVIKKLRQNNWFDVRDAERVFGIGIDGGDLEETDGTNIIWDPDTVQYFEKNLQEHGELAVRQLLMAEFTTGLSKTQMPRVQEALRVRLKEHGLDVPQSATPEPKEDKKEETT